MHCIANRRCVRRAPSVDGITKQLLVYLAIGKQPLADRKIQHLKRGWRKHLHPVSAKWSNKKSKNLRVFAGTCCREGYKANKVNGARS